MRVLISGTSIAGPVLTYQRNRFGFDVTVVELTPTLRKSGGHAVDRFRPAMQIVERMGVTISQSGVTFDDVAERAPEGEDGALRNDERIPDRVKVNIAYGSAPPERTYGALLRSGPQFREVGTDRHRNTTDSGRAHRSSRRGQAVDGFGGEAAADSDEGVAITSEVCHCL
jgi:hypothetical protein